MANKTSSIFDNLYIANINKNYTETYQGYKTYYYNLDYNIDNDWINNDIVSAFMEQVSPVISSLSKDYVFNLLIFGFKESRTFDKKLEIPSDNEMISRFLEVKRDFIKKYKTLKVYLTVTPVGTEKDHEPVLSKLKITPLNEVEIYNILFNILNPTMYRDDVSELPFNYSDLINPEISIPMALTKTPIVEKDDRLKFDTLNCFQYFMSSAPNLLNDELSLGKALNNLSTMDSDFFVSVIFRNKTAAPSLTGKKSFATSSLLQTMSALANNISSAVTDYFNRVNDKNLVPVEMSIQVALYNYDEKILINDSKKIRSLDGLEGAVFSPCIYSRYLDYMAMIPSVVQKYKYSFFVSSEQVATLLMFPKYEFNSTTLFEKKGNFLTSFDITDFSKTNKPGAIVFAPPGSGKSAFLNYIYFNMLIKYPKMESLIIDFGGSYKSLYNLLERDDMTYTDMTVKENVYYNPFDLDFGKEITKETINIKIFILKGFFTTVLKLEPEEYDTLIEIACEEMYNEIIFGHGKKRISSDREHIEGQSKLYIDRYNNSGYTDFISFAKAMPVFADFSRIVYSSTKIKEIESDERIRDFGAKLSGFASSLSTRMFQSNSTEYLLNTHLIADLKEVAMKDESLLNLILLYLLSSKLMKYMNVPEENKRYPRVIVIDEYEQFRSRSTFIDSFVSMIFKTGRKENLHLFIMSQNIGDFNKGFFNTSGRMISFQPSTMEELVEISKLTGEKESNLKALMNNIQTVRGEYSEFLVFNNDGPKTKNFYRLKITKEEYYSFITTSADEISRRAELIKQFNGNWKMAVEEMVRENTKRAS